ncbi:MAG: hypothetical protein N3A69_15480, partial [Leptospiraceae bacterium]|nr:hypothetical protein [Leptospiraceae bacterium]
MLIIKEQCYICGSNLGFINEDDATLLRESTCLACSANIKISDLAKFLVEAALGEFQPLKKVASALRDFRILHAGQQVLSTMF